MKALKRLTGVRWTSVAALLMLGPVAIVACDESVTGPPSPAVVQKPNPPRSSLQGSVEVFLTVALIDNSLKNPIAIDEQLEVLLDGQLRRTLRSGHSTMFAEVDPGEHSLELIGVRAQCHVVGNATRTIQVIADETAQIGFQVHCQSAPKDPRR